MDNLIWLVILAILAIAIINTIYSTIYKVVNMPSSPQTRRAIIDDIRTRLPHLPANPVIYDLGSGWGGFCRKVSNNIPEASVTGVEISPIPYLFSKIISILTFKNNYSLFKKDIFKTDIGAADIIICYLSPYHMKRFESDILPNIKSGSILYSQGFPMPNHPTDFVLEAPHSLEKKIYGYLIQ